MGGHHSPQDIWSVVAFVQTLPRTTPGMYRKTRTAANERGAGLSSAAEADHVH